MPDKCNDINELLAIAKKINEGRYDVDSSTIEPESGLFEIAEYFNESLKKLQEVSVAIEDSCEDLPLFEQVLNGIISESKHASEDVLSLVDKINFNINDMIEDMASLETSIEGGNKLNVHGTVDRLKDKSSKGQELCFDIIASLEFQDIVKQKINKLIQVVHGLEERLAHIIVKLDIDGKEIADNDPPEKEIMQSQSPIDKLLRELGH